MRWQRRRRGPLASNLDVCPLHHLTWTHDGPHSANVCEESLAWPFGQRRLSVGAWAAGSSTCVFSCVEGPRKLGFASKMETAGLISQGALFQPRALLSQRAQSWDVELVIWRNHLRISTASFPDARPWPWGRARVVPPECPTKHGQGGAPQAPAFPTEWPPTAPLCSHEGTWSLQPSGSWSCGS